MLAILGLMGILAAGMAADVIMGSPKGDDGDDDEDLAPQPEDDGGEDGAGDLIDYADGGTGGGAEDRPLSDDVPDEREAGQTIAGTDAGEVLSGGGGNDVVHGHAGNDLIDGRDGDDSLDAGDGNDVVSAGAGDDSLAGGQGNDSLAGQDGSDSLDGGAGSDTLTGSEGDDSLAGGAGADTLLGGAGADRAVGGTGDDWLAGGDGDDSLAGQDGSDIVDGNSGNDWLSGMDGEVDDFDADFLNGGAGNDQLHLGAGDYGTGGEDDDTFVLEAERMEGGVATISDYDVAHDQLVVMYDPAQHPDPMLSITVDPDTQHSTILLDGSAVAVVSGSPLAVADVRLVAAG